MKGVEFGLGFAICRVDRARKTTMLILCKGGKVVTATEHAGWNFRRFIKRYANHVMRIAIKPTPSIGKEQKTVNLSSMEDASITIRGRHDPCVVPKAVPAIEAAVAITLLDHMIRAGFIPKVLERQK